MRALSPVNRLDCTRMLCTAQVMRPLTSADWQQVATETFTIVHRTPRLLLQQQLMQCLSHKTSYVRCKEQPLKHITDRFTHSVRQQRCAAGVQRRHSCFASGACLHFHIVVARPQRPQLRLAPLLCPLTHLRLTSTSLQHPSRCP